MSNSKPEEFNLTLTVRPLPNGGVDAGHTFASSSDEARAERLPGCGVHHIAQAFFLEALRREGYLVVLGELTKDGQWLDTYTKASPEGRQAIEQQLAETISEMFRRGSEKQAPGVARGLLSMFTGEQGAEHG